MKAVAVFPGKPGSIHLANLPEPSVEDVPGGLLTRWRQTQADRDAERSH